MSLDGNTTYSHIKHLLIDEMQDYSPIQFKVIQKLYPCRKTILGDACQSVNPYGSSTAEMIRKAFAAGEVMKLCKSYRSTVEITGFAQKIRSNDELIPVVRHGKKPEILRFGNAEEEISAIAHLVSVIIPQTNKTNYCSEIDKSMLYVAVTRAMHQLTVTYSGEQSEFIRTATQH